MERPATANTTASLPAVVATPYQGNASFDKSSSFGSPAESAAALGLQTPHPSSTPQNPFSHATDAARAAAVAETERHPKSRRKRTAVKDKAILEEAYHANPKPDKTARLAIVARVSLNEKEVQIWFQNRRQNDRRKSRPLSPQELAALRYGGMTILSSDSIRPSSSFGLPLTSDHAEVSPPRGVIAAPGTLSHGLHLPSPARSGSVGPGCSADDLSGPQAQRLSQVSAATHEDVQGDELGLRTGLAPRWSSEAEDARPRLSQSSSFSSSVSYLSNRWNPCTSFSASSTPGHRSELFRLKSFSGATGTGPVLPPPTSSFRLGLSLEGKAEVVSSMPSPPHLPAPRGRRASLHRSHSASPVVTLPPISALMSGAPSRPGSPTAPLPQPVPLPPRLTRGRSRDVHAWELACDKENQSREDALAAQAKHESNGSAVAAISLLRSASSTSLNGGSPLQPSSSAKRNAPAPTRAGNKKPRLLGRASSSVARLQTETGEKGVTYTISQESDKEKMKGSAVVTQSGNESDKENWSPDEEARPRSSSYHPHLEPSTRPIRRPVPSAGGRSLKLAGSNSPRRHAGRGLRDHSSLGRNPPPVLGASRANTAPAGFSRGSGKFVQQQRSNHRKRQSPGLDIFEDGEADDGGSDSDGGGAEKGRPGTAPDDEVERFMKGLVSPSKKNDADAVAGLLSLSQGNWR